MSISPNEKFIILTEDVALPTKNFMGKKANLVKFIWLVKYCFDVFCSRLKFEENVFQIDMPPSFFIWRIRTLIGRGGGVYIHILMSCRRDFVSN